MKKIFELVRKINFLTLLLSFGFITICSCSKDDGTPDSTESDTENTDEEEDNNGEIDYSKVGVEYDDGTNVVFNVKIALDEHSLAQYPLEYWKTKLKKHWENVTYRFNLADREGGVDLTRNYIFVPDLEDILICPNDQKSNGFGSYAVENNLFDKNKFQVIVTYDSYCQAAVGEGSGGCGNKDGISLITVINAGSESKFYNHFEAQYTDDSVTHELGHFRGIIDIYNHPISAANNFVNGEPFEPIQDIMNGYTYGDPEDCFWNDYSLRIINLNKEKKVIDIINTTMYEYFADKLQIEVTENGNPVNEYTIKFYENKYVDGKNTMPDNNIYTIYEQKGGNVFKLDARKLFYINPDNNIWQRRTLFLVEISYDNKKAYKFLADYEVHNQGLIDKAEDKDKESTYILKFEL